MVGERDVQPAHPQRLRVLGRWAAEPQGGGAPFPAHDLDLSQRKPVAPSRAEGFEAGLLGRKAGGEGLVAIHAFRAIASLPGSEYALFKALAVCRQRPSHARDGDDVDADA